MPSSIVRETLLVFRRQLRNRIRSYSYDLLISHWYLHTCSPLLRNLPWTTPTGAVHNTLMEQRQRTSLHKQEREAWDKKCQPRYETKDTGKSLKLRCCSNYPSAEFSGSHENLTFDLHRLLFLTTSSSTSTATTIIMCNEPARPEAAAGLPPTTLSR
jgi:hypothetical protein